MAQSNFLSDNENRNYPFRADAIATMTRTDAVAVVLPTEAVVEFLGIAGLDSGWIAGVSAVYLHGVRRAADGSFAFEFRATAAGLLGVALTFTRPANATEFMTTAADAVLIASGSLGTASLGGYCGNDLLWTGRLTTGRMEALAAILAPGQAMYATDGQLVVRDAATQDTASSYVRSINLANAARNVATAPTGCPAAPTPEYPPGTPVVNATCLIGALSLVEGFNTTILQNNRTNTLTVVAGVGGGAGMPCNEVPLYPSEVPPVGSSLLSGGLTCGDVVSSVNGISTAALRIIQGIGMTVTPSPVIPNTLVIAVGAGDLLACVPYFTSSH